MTKCDLCKNTASYMLVDDSDKLIAYLCDKHAAKPTRFKLKEIVQMPVLTQVCTLCGTEKTIDEFYQYTDSRGVKRRRGECKECNLAERKMRRLRKK